MSSGLATPPVQRTPETGAPRDRKAFRKDIQGLRAIGLMFLFFAHSEFSFASGGFVALDLFFVLSGFLITGLILEEMKRTGSLSLTKFYARRVRRLLPAAVLVLVFVLVGSWFIYSPLRAEMVAGDVVAASLYVVNWRFQAQEIDYFAVDPSDSPLQHYWSLSVEEQFYFVWPLLLLGAFIFLARRSERRMRLALGAGVALIGVPSLVYSAKIMDAGSNAAYFSTPARMWEFALGGLLALVLPASLKLPKFLVSVLMWVGLGIMFTTAYLFSFETAYPGSAALWPALATVGMLIAGTATVTNLPLRILSTRPAQYVGDISYCWYLWHWPVLVFARAEWGTLTHWKAMGVIAVSFVPTALTHHFLEDPIRYSRGLAKRPKQAISFGFASIALAVVLASSLNALQPDIDSAASADVPGAIAVPHDPKHFQKEAKQLKPTPAEAKEDRGTMYDDGCLVPHNADEPSPPCYYGDESGDKKAVLMGDSHAMHYFPGLNRVAKRRDWQLVGLTRAACTAADLEYEPRCDRWRESTFERIEERERPDMVLVSTSTTSPRGKAADGTRRDQEASEPLFEAAFKRTLQRLQATGAKVVVIADTPRSPQDVAECVSEHQNELHNCVFPNDRKDEFDVRAARDLGIDVIEPARLFCPKRQCAPVIGNALVYRDDNHFTASFAGTMTEWLERELPDMG